MIGILGGSFDPVHAGHLRIALEIMHGLQCTSVHLIPSALPPHREPAVASAAERLAMLRLAVTEIDSFIVDDREITRGGTSYTIDTLESLRSEYAGQSLCLMMGMDAYCGLPGWHRWREIPEWSHIAVAHRPGALPSFGSELEAFTSRSRTMDARELYDNSAGRVIFQEVTQLDISSSAIREMIAMGKSPRFLMPDKVVDYIEKKGVYRS
jgi:nicotinate-nucleotide adenylyltransferase